MGIFEGTLKRKLATLLEKRLWYKCFPVNFVKFLKISFPNRTPLTVAFDVNVEAKICNGFCARFFTFTKGSSPNLLFSDDFRRSRS